MKKTKKNKKKQFKTFIQTTEMMLSSYLNNNSKPIIRGFSIQKKIIPDDKQVLVHANIITNEKRNKRNKRNKTNKIKKLKK
jgi:hypothetical protein